MNKRPIDALTRFEAGVVLDFLLHTMQHDQREKLFTAFPVQYDKLFPTIKES